MLKKAIFTEFPNSAVFQRTSVGRSLKICMCRYLNYLVRSFKKPIYN